MIIKYMSGIEELGDETKDITDKDAKRVNLLEIDLGNNASKILDTFFEKNADFLKFSQKFQVAGWENVLKSPNQNKDKLRIVVNKYLQQMLKVKKYYCKDIHI